MHYDEVDHAFVLCRSDSRKVKACPDVPAQRGSLCRSISLSQGPMRETYFARQLTLPLTLLLMTLRDWGNCICGNQRKDGRAGYGSLRAAQLPPLGMYG